MTFLPCRAILCSYSNNTVMLMDNSSTVCLLNDSFPPLIDGVVNAVMNYADALPAAGFSPIVITPDHPQAEDSLLPYPVIRYPSIDFRDKTGGYMAGIPFSPDIARQLEGRKIAVLHSHCPIASTILARELRSIVDAPLIMTYHTKFDIDIASVLHSRALQAGSKRALVENISACDEVWAVSRGAGENLKSLGYEGDYIVMPNGVDLPRGRVSDETVTSACQGFDLPKEAPVYLFVGRIRWYKGLRIILEGLAKHKAAGNDFRMVFIGEGSDMEEVRAYASELGIGGPCIYTGAIRDREALRAWYCRADLFLFPSTFDTNGLVVREAAACGLAAVLIRGSCAAEDVTDGRNGFLIAENAESLASLLARLDPEEIRQVGRNAQAELYLSWEDSVKNAAERYEVVIDRYRSGLYPAKRRPMEHVLRQGGELMEDFARLHDSLRSFGDKLRDRLDERFL